MIDHNGKWFLDPERGLPFEQIIEISFQRSPGLRERVQAQADRMGISVTDLVRQIRKQWDDDRAADPEAWTRKTDWMLQPYGPDPQKKGR